MLKSKTDQADKPKPFHLPMVRKDGGPKCNMRYTDEHDAYYHGTERQAKRKRRVMTRRGRKNVGTKQVNKLDAEAWRRTQKLLTL